MRILPSTIFALLLLAPLTAAAEEPVSTARSAAATPTTADQIDAWLADAPPVDIDDGQPDGVTSSSERQVHGEVGVSVGTGGYRSAYAIVALPVGETSTLTLAVSETRGRGWAGPGGREDTRRTLNLNFATGRASEDAFCAGPPAGPMRFEDHATPDLFHRRCDRRPE